MRDGGRERQGGGREEGREGGGGGEGEGGEGEEAHSCPPKQADPLLIKERPLSWTVI